MTADLSTCGQVLYRVIEGPRPSGPDVLAEEFRYGAKLLYLEGPPPAEPIHVDGVVIHSTALETRYFVGTRNPLLDQLDALNRIENDKYFEAELVRSVAPEAFARTELVALHWPAPCSASPESHLAALEHEMHQRYPSGFVLKPISSFATDGKFPSDRTPFVALWREFKANAEPRIARLAAAGVDPTDIHFELRNDPSYPGRILDALLMAPETVMLQERLDIAESNGLLEEYRVHVVCGDVLDGATQHRWGNYRATRPERLRQVEAFVRDIVRKLPAPYNALTYGVDVAGLADGSLVYLEGNAGWESHYFSADVDVWVANLLAARCSGLVTPFLEQFRRFSATPGLYAKIARLRRLLAHQHLQAPVAKRDPITEILARARTVLFDEFRQAPTRDHYELLCEAIAEFALAPYLTSDELCELDEVESSLGFVRAA